MKKLILFDIDNTIFDSLSFRKDVFEKVSKALHRAGTKKSAEEVEKIVDELIEKYGFFDPEMFVKLLEHLSQTDKQKIKDIFIDREGMKSFVYKEMITLIAKFTKLGEIGILSQGETKYQLAKFASISNHFRPERIHIAFNKMTEMVTIFEKYGNYKVYYVDDLLSMLAAAKEIRSDIVTIWSKRGLYVNKQKTPFKPDLEIENLTQAYHFIKNN